jgi:hypothetical protein
LPQSRNEARASSEGEATIVLSRISISRPGRNRFTVRIDGALVGKIAAGETKRYDVEPGSHKMQLGMGWAASRETLHPDLAHSEPIEPHWDYRAPDRKFYLISPDGRVEPS